MKHRKVTDNDVNMLIYFWEKKEDITVYSEYPQIENDLKDNYPWILKSIKKYHNTRDKIERQLNNLFHQIP